VEQNLWFCLVTEKESGNSAIVFEISGAAHPFVSHGVISSTFRMEQIMYAEQSSHGASNRAKATENRTRNGMKVHAHAKSPEGWAQCWNFQHLAVLSVLSKPKNIFLQGESTEDFFRTFRKFPEIDKWGALWVIAVSRTPKHSLSFVNWPNINSNKRKIAFRFSEQFQLYLIGMCSSGFANFAVNSLARSRCELLRSHANPGHRRDST
jgi:hypothetical protein